MRTARHIALAAIVAAIPACAGSAPCQGEFGGYPWGEMPDLDMLVGETVETEVWRHFLPPDCQVFFSTGFMAESADPAAVAVSATDSLLTAVALAVADSVRVTVWPVIDGPLDPQYVAEQYFHEFHVRIRPRP